MVKHIICSSGEVVLCDDEDYPLLSRFLWCMGGAKKNESGGYPSTSFYGKRNSRYQVFMHQLVMGGVVCADHRDGNTLNNQKGNLRQATYQQNGWNSVKIKVTGTGKPPSSQYKGVSRYTNAKGEVMWRVIFILTKKGEKPSRHFRKSGFKTEIEAARFYNEEVVKHRGEWALLNKLPEDSREQPAYRHYDTQGYCDNPLRGY